MNVADLWISVPLVAHTDSNTITQNIDEGMLTHFTKINTLFKFLLFRHISPQMCIILILGSFFHPHN